MNPRITQAASLASALLASAILLSTVTSCVDHRDLRTEVYNENIYLEKEFLTRENPLRSGSKDHAWLYGMTVTKTSFPDIPYMMYIGDYSPTRYVRFQFSNDKMEMVDDSEAAATTYTDKNKTSQPSPSLSRTVMNTWPGTHVDIQLRDNLDGERTNLIEENRERDWEERQFFKVDLTKSALADVNMLWWANTDYNIGECMTLRSVSLVPGSFELEDKADDEEKPGDDYFSWTVAVTYELRVFGGGYWCGDIFANAADRTTVTYHIKYSFWRPPKSTYKPVEFAEKASIREKLGAFETAVWGHMNLFYDPKTEIFGSKSYLMRFDPNKTHTFYFSESFPEEYKSHFTTDVTKQVNDLMQKLGVKFRIQFKDHDFDFKDTGKKRTFGDVRYSMLHYHTVPFNNAPIGMATLNPDPRTGEILSGGFNMYNWEDNLYTYFIEDYVKEVTKDTFDSKSPLTTPCTAGTTVPIDKTKIASKASSSSLYNKLETYMNETSEKWVPKRTEEFGKYMRMLLDDIRFSHPGYNQYTWRTRPSAMGQSAKMDAVQQKFQQHLSDIDQGKSPFGSQNVLSKAGIEAGLASLKAAKEGVRNHFQLQARQRMANAYRVMDRIDMAELAPAMIRSSRMCKSNRTWETRDEWAKRIVDNWFKVFATHEFGHTLSLRHNFYGSLDKPHFAKNAQGADDITSSIMEYAYTLAEAGDSILFKPHDIMALSWIYAGKEPAKGEVWLYCTDDHVALSPFCTQGDIGVTPTEIVKNEIDKYEWLYKFRNFRAYRKLWPTYTYYSEVLNRIYPLRRFLNLWGIDWYGSNIKNNLSLLGVTGDEVFFKNITDEFLDEMGRANRLTVNFYKAILQQSSAERSYATKFDKFYGDITQQGIILDKYFAMLFFIGLWPAEEYDWNVYAYLSYHESSYGNALYKSDADDAVDAMIGGQYDVYPWFKPTAVLLFAQDTHDVMFADASKQKWIEMKRFDRISDLKDYFNGMDPRDEALKVDNPYQTFTDKQGLQWIYYYIADRNVHLVAQKDKNPTAYKILWDQNESINKLKSTSLDDYEIKYYLDFYEYFN